MIRTLNFAFIAITCLVCLGVYRTAEKARVEQVELKITRAEIVKETAALSILGAEWARVTEPKRIQALVQHNLDLSDKPGVELSSLSQLPPKNPPLAPEGEIRSNPRSRSARLRAAIRTSAPAWKTSPLARGEYA